jgi:hypothetical protein
VTFASYSDKELVLILEARVGRSVFQAKALDYIARNVAACSGDARAALEMASNAENGSYRFIQHMVSLLVEEMSVEWHYLEAQCRIRRRLQFKNLQMFTVISSTSTTCFTSASRRTTAEHVRSIDAEAWRHATCVLLITRAAPLGWKL